MSVASVGSSADGASGPCAAMRVSLPRRSTGSRGGAAAAVRPIGCGSARCVRTQLARVVAQGDLAAAQRRIAEGSGVLRRRPSRSTRHARRAAPDRRLDRRPCGRRVRRPSGRLRARPERRRAWSTSAARRSRSRPSLRLARGPAELGRVTDNRNCAIYKALAAEDQTGGPGGLGHQPELRHLQGARRRGYRDPGPEGRPCTSRNSPRRDRRRPARSAHAAARGAPPLAG